MLLYSSDYGNTQQQPQQQQQQQQQQQASNYHKTGALLNPPSKPARDMRSRSPGTPPLPDPTPPTGSQDTPTHYQGYPQGSAEGGAHSAGGRKHQLQRAEDPVGSVNKRAHTDQGDGRGQTYPSGNDAGGGARPKYGGGGGVSRWGDQADRGMWGRPGE